METEVNKKYYVSGYGGYIPGDKWRFGGRSNSEPPPFWRNLNGFATENENFITQQKQLQQQQDQLQLRQQRPQSRRQRLQSSKSNGSLLRAANNFDLIATRPMDHSTQFPVRTTEMAIQADVDNSYGIQNDMANRQISQPQQGQILQGYLGIGGQDHLMGSSSLVEPPRGTMAVTNEAARRGRPPSRAGGQRPMPDGRIINNQRPDVLFSMNNDPFKGLSTFGGTNETRRTGRYYDQQQQRYINQNQGGQGIQGIGGQDQLFGNGSMVNDGYPTAGYSGHIPGLRASVGKPYGDAIRYLRETKLASTVL